MAAYEKLTAQDIAVRVVSMPSWEIFEAQDEDYRKKTLPPSVKARVAVEAGVPYGWERYVGREGKIVGINRFGASAPGSLVMERLGVTAEAVIGAARKLL